MKGDSGLRVICTDRGRHEPRIIPADVGRMIEDTVNVDLPTDLTRTPRRPDGGVTYVFDCPSCPQHKELRDDTWYALREDLDGLGVSTLDISALPF